MLGCMFLRSLCFILSNTESYLSKVLPKPIMNKRFQRFFISFVLRDHNALLLTVIGISTTNSYIAVSNG